MTLKFLIVATTIFVSGCQSNADSFKETAAEIANGLGFIAKEFRRQLIRDRALEKNLTPAEYERQDSN